MCEERNQYRELFSRWITDNSDIIEPTFEEDDRQEKRVKTLQLRERNILCIDKELKNAIIKVVKGNINDEKWQGFLYIMGKYIKENNEKKIFFPLYVGKTAKIGTRKPISSNIENIETNNSRFARWGHGNYWHIGQLSNSLFNRTQESRHDNWAKELFCRPLESAVLKKKVYLAIISWYVNCQSPSCLHKCLCHLELEMIKLAKRANRDLLNIHIPEDGSFALS